MCGINGGYNTTRATIASMVQATAHRGPDATGMAETGPVIFGHNRLSIIDVSSRSNQPMQSPDGRHLLVFNGEIYNYQALRQALPEWSFVSDGDSEVLLAALASWGLDALTRLQGIFAFAWFDVASDTLTLVRDHVGVKPLYYTAEAGSVVFSSELGGMIAGTGKRTLDPTALAHYFNGNFVPSPDTMIAGIKKLQPGHYLQFHAGTLCKSERYYTPAKATRRPGSAIELRHVIGEEVKAQLVSDRPVGVFLSGGLDSSIVLHHAAAVGKIRTFSTSFEMIQGGEGDDEKFNADATLAKKTAEYYGCEHTDFRVSLTQVQNELIDLLGRLDEPVANPITASQLLLSQSVREAGIVVALGGDGGDELWGGYSRHAAVLSAQYYQSLPAAVRTPLSSLHPLFGRLNTPLGAPLHASLTLLPQAHAARVLRQPLSSEPSQTLLLDRYAGIAPYNLSPIEAFMRVDRELWLADDALQRSDRASMAVGVELRVPLLGLPIVNYADQIFAEKKFTPFTNKKLLRTAYQSELPAHLFNQPKRGWMAPGSKWFRDSVIEAQIRQIFSDQYYDGLSALVDWGAVQELLTDHITTKTYALNPLWNLLLLQVWAKRFGVTI